MSGYFCIGFIDFMLKGKCLLEYTNLFSPNDYEKNDKIILKYFQQNIKLVKMYYNVCNKYRKLQKITTKYHIFLKKH